MASNSRRFIRRIAAGSLVIMMLLSLILPGYVHADEEEIPLEGSETIVPGKESEETQTPQPASAITESVEESGQAETAPSRKTRSQTDGTEEGEITPHDAGEHELTAAIYNTAQYAGGGDKLELTPDGVELNGWEFNTSKYMQIDIDVPQGESEEHVVVVRLPKEFYVVGNVETVTGGWSKVEFQKNEDVPVNIDSTYTVNAGSGTIRYYLASGMEHATIQLELRYDVTLWDKQAGSYLTADDVAPVAVSLVHEESGTDTEVMARKLNKATAGSAMLASNGIHYRKDGDTSWSSTPTVARDLGVLMQSVFSTAVYERTECYYQNARVEIQIPCYTDKEGNKSYLSYDADQLAFLSFTGKANYSVIEKTEEKLIVELDKPLFAYSSFLSLPFSYPETLKTEETSILFTGGKVQITAQSNNGQKNLTIFDREMGGVRYYTREVEEVKLTPGNKSVTCVNRPEGGVSLLGGYYAENLGSADSTEKKIHVEFADGLLVTTMNLLADVKSKTIQVEYTLVDREGEPVYLDSSGQRVENGKEGATGQWTYSLENSYYNTVALNNLYNRLTRGMLPDGQREYFFKTVTYTIQNIQSGSRMYSPSSNAATSGTGNFYGYFTREIEAGASLLTKVTFTSPEDSQIEPLEVTVITNPTAENNPAYGIENVTMSKTSIQAGESVEISGRVFVISYPYGNSVWLKGMRLGIVLPEGASINEDSIQLTGNQKNSMKVESLTRGESKNGQVLWTIKVDPEENIGYGTEDLTQLREGSVMKFEMQIDTDKNMDASTLFTSDMLYVAGDDQKNSAGGSYSWASHTDVWDLNGNGDTNDKIGGTRLSDRKQCTIIPNSAIMSISDSVTVTGEGTSDGKTAKLLSEDDTVTYSLTLQCMEGGEARDFDYYIPIPKSDSVRDSHLVTGDLAEAFSFELLGEAQITGNSIYSIQYTTENGLTYEGARNLDEECWLTAEQIAEKRSWSEVTMLRLTVPSGKIENGMDTTIAVNMKYSGDNYPAEAGMNNVWKSCGYYTYSSGHRVMTGNFPTAGCSVILNYSWSNTEEQESVVLTAAKGMTPTAPNTNRVTVRTNADGEENSFPRFKNAQTFTITDVQTSGVILQTKEYLRQNGSSMPGIDANQTFGITVSMGEGEKEIDFKDGVGQEIGTSAALTAPQFTFRLYNADALSDITTERSVTVTLTSNKGVTIQVKIDINRELAAADDPKSAIIAGKVYTPFADTQSSVVISQDSAFTAQFVATYIPVNYDGERTIAFSDSLPEGTTLLMADVTKADEPVYWHYTLDGTETEVKFSQLYQIGTVQTTGYENAEGTEEISKRVLLVVDFSGCESFPETKKYTVTLRIGSNKDEIYEITTTLTFETEKERTFTISGESEAEVNQDYVLRYGTESSGAAESKYSDRRVALLVTPKEETELPVDAYLLVGNTRYYRNENGQFIVPLAAIQESAGQTDVTMRLCSDMLPKGGASYALKMELWASATDSGTDPLLGECEAEHTVTFTAQQIPQPAWKVTGMTPRLLHTKDLGTDIIVNYQCEKLDGCTVTVELQKKEGAGYTLLTDVMSSVNGSTNHNMGAFTIADSTSGQIKIRLSSNNAKAGTYRLCFRVKGAEGDQLLEIPYNFIIAEE